jgi:putative nucleotidyltransferase with HDIG domain
MSQAIQKRTRQQRVASVELPPGVWKSFWTNLQRGRVLLRVAMCAAAGAALCVLTRSWDAPYRMRLGETPQRNLIARVDFEQVDLEATREARQRARQLAVGVYQQDPKPLEQLRAQLRSELGKLLAAERFEAVDQDLWEAFLPPPAPGTPEPTPTEEAEQFARLRAAFAAENAFETFSAQLADAMAPLDQWGVLGPFPADYDANFARIEIRAPKNEGFGSLREVSLVSLDAVTARLQQALDEKLGSLEISQRAFAWLRPRLTPTLTLNVEATRAAQDKASAEVPQVTRVYQAGRDVLALAGKPLAREQLELLRLEDQAVRAQRTWSDRLERLAASLGLYAGTFTLCGFYALRRERRIVDDLWRLASLLTLAVLTVGVCLAVSRYSWTGDVIPLQVFAMIVAIVYHQELALLAAGCLTLIVAVAIGHSFAEAIAYLATCAGAIIVLRQVRTRSKLLFVGFAAALVGLLTSLGVGVLFEQSRGLWVSDGLAIALWSIIAGSLLTVLLPTVERAFGVQTDLSLIELGDPAHPLLQELIRRAPGTYNHSITVASLAEAAAESIGARGLLVRVGAYFHDIGKMLKPGYFVENQTKGDNRHDALAPAMSTLVIIAHVKDGADLARQNRLPEAIIDFIQQHHGTTLVEYFYRQASERSRREDPDAGAVDESSFRYPGPKPQTKEAGVLMLADAVESASRVLKEPTPSRIENLVEEITMKRLLDGQFDESGLTLEEVRKVGESLVKSLTAVYHGRVKYPDQEIA